MEYELNEGIAVLHFDDGKVNAIGFDFMKAIREGLASADREAKAVVVAGRAGILSGGFDLKEFRKGPEATNAMMAEASPMFHRLFSLPQPLIVACTGHAVAAGALLLLVADNRIGSAGDFKIALNETSIGFSFPVFGIELARARLDPAYLTRSFVQSEVFGPDEAVRAGFFDRVVPPEEVLDAALEKARQLAELPREAYAKNKRDIRSLALGAIEASL